MNKLYSFSTVSAKSTALDNYSGWNPLVLPNSLVLDVITREILNKSGNQQYFQNEMSKGVSVCRIVGPLFMVNLLGTQYLGIVEKHFMIIFLFEKQKSQLFN